MPVRFSPRCPNSDYLGFEASPEAIVTAAKKAEEVGFDAIFVNDHISLTAPPAQHRGPMFGIRSLRCRSLQRTRWLGSGLWAAGRSRMSSFKISGAYPIQGFTLGRCGAHCHGKRASKRPAPIRPLGKAASKSQSLKQDSGLACSMAARFCVATAAMRAPIFVSEPAVSTLKFDRIAIFWGSSVY